MPELPEVETIKRDLAKRIIGLSVEDVVVHDTMVVRFPNPKDFSAGISGSRVVSLQRHGKAIVFSLSNSRFLVVQLGMTGQLIYGEKNPNAKIIFKLCNGHYLNYNDQRRFGRLNLIRDLQDLNFLKTLGVEPLSMDFNTDWLKKGLKKHKSPIKSLLLNQNFVAGIGNIYASEILFRAKINPKRQARRLKKEEIAKLHHETVCVLKEAIKARGSSVKNYRDGSGKKGHFINRIKVYGRDHEACGVCATPILRIVQSGRSTFYCPFCQGKI